MCGLAIVCNSCDWSKCFNIKIHPLKVEFKYIFFRELPFRRFMHSLRKMKTFLCGESLLRHNKTNCFPSYLDHYLIFLTLRASLNALSYKIKGGIR